ncbi:sulfite exporter TauE/SafE family protein [Candidatus Woesearchaeota archaeon]|nr:sulfite exporter TauE/SafE family protein [Candidatus Woesearchaeota archaeon]
MRFKARGMHCTSCEKVIGKALINLDGVNNVKVDYATESVDVEFDEDKISLKDIKKAVESKGYDCSDRPTMTKKTLGLIFGVIGLVVVLYFIMGAVDGIQLPTISSGMTYGLLFVVGLLTGFHCIAMCGGFVVSYTTKSALEGKKPYKAHLGYAVGKTLSYTLIGAAFGLIGAIITFTPMIRGVVGIAAGAFLIIFGLNMLNIFPALRKLQVRMPKFLGGFVSKEKKKSTNPLVIGLLNGLMIACGPLLAIYIMAAGTGSVLEGAKLLFVFGLGTLPVMIGFGFVTSYLSSKATHKILKASGAIVIILGLIMVNRGLALTGTGLDMNSFLNPGPILTGESTAIDNGYQVIEMDVTRYGWEPDKFVLKKGVPVKWKINGKEITGCNNAIQVPKLGLEFGIKQGEQVIEFTPEEEGTISWSCWMGMIPGAFIVKDDIDVNNAKAVQQEIEAVHEQPRGSCGGSCGSSTCGAASGGSCGCGA